MIKRELLETIYDAAHIQRWNDHLRPRGFTELSKQAHKMIIAYVVARFEETDRGVRVDWRKLIEGGIFELLHRVVLTDIKPPIFHQLMKESGPELNYFVLEQLKDQLDNLEEGAFLEKFSAYLFDASEAPLEKKILRASHYLASSWEFKFIYHLNQEIYGVEETRENIESELEEHYHLAGVQKLWLGKKTYHFLDLVGQLRFQQRWAHSPRIPETSVLGHMLVVAVLAYFGSITLGACDGRLYHNFFAALLHDLPEILTRDIISPVKRSVSGLEDLLKRIEKRQLEEKILPLLPLDWHEEIKYFVEEEFADRVIIDKQVHRLEPGDIGEHYNYDEYRPVDGSLIKACDDLAAFIEASLSIFHGVTSRHLKEAREQLYGKYRGWEFDGLGFGGLFEFFYHRS